MNKKMLELLNKIEAQKITVKDLVDAGKLDEAKDAKNELQKLQDSFDILKDMGLEEPQEPVQNHATPTPAAPKKNAVQMFAEAARRGFRTNMTEGTPADGGYTVPQDIQTQINKFKEEHFSLENLVSVIPVTAPTGRRTFQSRANHTGFSAVGEGTAIGKVGEPKFEVIEYSVKKYAGYLPATNELLTDSDANITAVISQWLAEEDVATRNTIILKALGEATKTELKDLDGIKKAINATLGSAFAGSSVIVTNDDGLNYLDTLKDANGQYLLKPALNPDSPLSMTLAVGARRIPVTVVPNSILKTGTKNAMPFIIGDLKEAVKVFDRQQMQIATSSEAAATGINAFEQDMTLFRGIERLDCKLVDSKAVVYGTITPASV